MIQTPVISTATARKLSTLGDREGIEVSAVKGAGDCEDVNILLAADDIELFLPTSVVGTSTAGSGGRNTGRDVRTSHWLRPSCGSSQQGTPMQDDGENSTRWALRTQGEGSRVIDGDCVPVSRVMDLTNFVARTNMEILENVVISFAGSLVVG